MSKDYPFLQISCRRDYYRLRYPVAQRPRIFIQTHEYVITELSEKGLRFRTRYYGDNLPFKMGEEVEGTLVLATATLHVGGTIGRQDDDETVMLDVAGVSFHRMLEEQRHLARVCFFGEDFSI
ncbi:MAG: PilZ domain-containing protein [Planctomycetales bacterium]|nr:PilZ domain-containing protein [Planctomycetales bacterium]